MNVVDEIRSLMGDAWLPAIYREKVRSQRTRAYSLEVPKRENRAEIQYTLLGIELKVGKRRFACPDLATARYLRVFARLGCKEFALPYDITLISGIADELESSWQIALLHLSTLTGIGDGEEQVINSSPLSRVMRLEIEKIGPGEAMPLFDRETRNSKPSE